MSQRWHRWTTNWIRPFLQWWSGELVSLVPAPLRRVLGLECTPLRLRESGGILTLEPPDHRRQSSVIWGTIDEGVASEEALACLGTYNASDTPLEIILEARHALNRKVGVPRTAQSEIRGLLSFEIERHTPYHGDEVYLSYELDPAASDAATISADVSVLPKSTINGLLQTLSASGFTPHAVRLEATASDAPSVFSRGDLSLPARGFGRGLAVWSAAAAILAIIAVSVPLSSLRSSADDLRGALADAGERSDPAMRIRQESERLRAAAMGVIEAKAAAPRVIETLEVLSKLTPDGTWLRLVSFVDDELVIEGLTDSASKLVGLLEGSPQFSDVAYTAPVTKERGGRLERFSFSMKFEKASK